MNVMKRAHNVISCQTETLVPLTNFVPNNFINCHKLIRGILNMIPGIAPQE